MNSPEKEKREQETYESFFAEPDQVKSLRPQHHWKPSEEQMKALEKYVETQDLNFLKPEIVKRIFKAGAEWMAGQGETIDGSLCYDPHLQMVIVFLEDCPKMWEGSIMDVTVQIRKKED